MFVENKRFKVILDANGIVSSIYDKKDNKEIILSNNPIKVLIDNDNILEKSTVQISNVDKKTIVSKYITNSTTNYRVSVEISYKITKSNVSVEVKVINLDNVNINCVVLFEQEVIYTDLINTKTVVNGRYVNVVEGNSVELQKPNCIDINVDKNNLLNLVLFGYTNVSILAEEKKEKLACISYLQIPSNSFVVTNACFNVKNDVKVTTILKYFLVVFLLFATLFSIPAYKYLGYYYYVTSQYDGEVNKEQMQEAIYSGITQGLNNPYSSYLTDEDYALLMNQSDIFGFALMPDPNYNIMIGSIENNTQADKSGLCPGDIILSVDGQKVNVRTVDLFYEITQEDKEYTFNIYRPASNQTLDVKLSKAKPIIDTVSYKMYDSNNKKYGYIKITSFEEETIEQFKEALNSVKTQGMDELIIDVCDNPGGNVATVQAILSMLVKTNEPIFQFTSDGEVVQNFYSDLEEDFDYPISVLQNENSASASEMLSLVLKEYKDANIIGTKSYGKGTGQSIIKNSFGPGYIKLTTFHWQSGKGTSIEGVGVEPTTEVSEAYDSIVPLYLTDMVTINSEGKNALLLNRYLYYLGYNTDPNSMVCNQTTIDALNQFCRDNGLSANSKLTPEIAKVLVKKAKESYNQPKYNPILKTALGQ